MIALTRLRRQLVDLVGFACLILFPPLVRGLLMSAAEAGLFAPIWSQRILDEWRISLDSVPADADVRAFRRWRESFRPSWPRPSIPPSSPTISITT